MIAVILREEYNQIKSTAIKSPRYLHLVHEFNSLQTMQFIVLNYLFLSHYFKISFLINIYFTPSTENHRKSNKITLAVTKYAREAPDYSGCD